MTARKQIARVRQLTAASRIEHTRKNLGETCFRKRSTRRPAAGNTPLVARAATMAAVADVASDVRKGRRPD